MKKKIKIILSISGLAIFVALSVYVVKFISDGPYRSKLPKYPDFNSISKPLKTQIRQAGLKAYLNPTAHNLGELGMVYNSAQDHNQALSCYQLAAEKSKRDWIWFYYLGYLNLQLSNGKACIENFIHVIERNPRNYMALYYIAQAYQDLGSISNAENIYKRIISANDCDPGRNKINRESYFPLQTYAMYNVARLYMEYNKLDSAETVLKDIIKLQWTFGLAYRTLGNVYNKKGDSILSKKYITRAGDLNEYFPPPDTLADKIALMSRSEEYLIKPIEDAKSSFNFDWELQLCTHGLKYLPDNKDILSNTIVLYFILGRDKDVLPLLDRHIKSSSDDFEELMNIAELLYGKGFESQAMTYFNQAKKVEPGNSKLAIWLLSIDKKSDAVSLINEQLKKEPKNERILTDAVRIYLESGVRVMAMTLLSRLDQLYPSSIEAKKAHGLLLEMDGKRTEAETLYEEILNSGQKDLSIVKYLSSLYIQDKMWDKAILVFRKGLENYPNEPELLEQLGSLLISCPDIKLREVNEGKEFSERAYIHYKCPPPTRINAAKNLATAYAISGEKQMAARYIKITLDMVSRGKFPSQGYISYFEGLKKQFNLSN